MLPAILSVLTSSFSDLAFLAKLARVCCLWSLLAFSQLRFALDYAIDVCTKQFYRWDKSWIIINIHIFCFRNAVAM
jgi:hypothetical protein